MPTVSERLRKGFSDWRRTFLSRPHRSFRLTRRRDAIRPMRLPGYLLFSYQVTRTVWRQRKVFGPLLALYITLYVAFVGLTSQETYTSIVDAIDVVDESGAVGPVTDLSRLGSVFISVTSLAFGSGGSDVRTIFGVLLALYGWLTIVWLLRDIMVGKQVRLRDGLFNSGAPFLAMVCIVGFMVIQSIPVGIALIGYSAALATGLLAGGAATMLFWIAAGLLGVLSAYFLTTSLVALVIVTLPGMYPLRAMRAAGDLVVGRRLTLLLRLLWMGVAVVSLWAVILIPLILAQRGLVAVWPGGSWLAVVPVALVVLGGFSLIWIATYVYLLYRRLVEHG